MWVELHVEQASYRRGASDKREAEHPTNDHALAKTHLRPQAVLWTGPEPYMWLTLEWKAVKSAAVPHCFPFRVVACICCSLPAQNFPPS